MLDQIFGFSSKSRRVGSYTGLIITRETNEHFDRVSGFSLKAKWLGDRPGFLMETTRSAPLLAVKLRPSVVKKLRLQQFFYQKTVLGPKYLKTIKFRQISARAFTCRSEFRLGTSGILNVIMGSGPRLASPNFILGGGLFSGGGGYSIHDCTDINVYACALQLF